MSQLQTNTNLLEDALEVLKNKAISGTNDEVSSSLINRSIVNYSDNQNNVLVIGQHAFNRCENLTSVNIPSATRIEHYSFSNCGNLKNINMDSANFIGDYAFFSCYNLNIHTIPINVVELNVCTFSNCHSIKYINTRNVRTIGGDCFAWCENLQQIVMPNIVEIHDGAFKNCKSLKQIEFIQNNDVSISDNVFASSGIHTVLIRTYGRVNIPSYNDNPFVGTPIADGFGRIFVPSQLLQEYKTANGWNAYSDIIYPLEENTEDGTINGEIIKATSFNVNDGNTIIKFEAERDMTWSSFVSSNYNDGSFEITDFVRYNGRILYPDSTMLGPTILSHYIIDNNTYYINYTDNEPT